MIRRRLAWLLLASCLVVGCGGRVDTTDSPNLIAYTVLDKGYGEIWIMNADGSNARRVTQPAPAGSDADGAKNPALSPDGTRIAYVSTGDAIEQGDRYLDLYVVDVDGGTPVRLTDDAYPDRDPAWSPDGERIAFTHDVGLGQTVIEIIDADGGNRRTLVATGEPGLTNDSSPTWSPDGEQIAFAHTQSGSEGPTSAAVCVVDAEGGTQRPVVDGALSPAWSPDGTRLAFVKYRPAYTDECQFCGIHVVDVDGTGLSRLTEPLAFDTTPAWSPDGTEIVFMSDRTGHDPQKGTWGWELYVMEADGSNVRRLTANDVSDGEPDWR